MAKTLYSIEEEYKKGRRNFSGANLCDADLRCAHLYGADLYGANLYGADLYGADLRGANLRGADLRGAHLYGADLRGAHLYGANLYGANLYGADLRGANLSGVQGLLDAIEWLEANFEKDDLGYIVYKTFNENYTVPDYWTIAPGAILSEEVNFDRTNTCACGINVATLDWVKINSETNADIWKCRIRFLWLISAVVPYHTDGKFRVGRLELLEQVS